MEARAASVADAKSMIEPLRILWRDELAAVEMYDQVSARFGPDAPSALQECRQSHLERAEKLTARIVELGGVPTGDSGRWRSFAHAVKRDSGRFSRQLAISALEEGEDRCISLYEANLDDLDEESQCMIINDLLPEQHFTHHRMSTLMNAVKKRQG